MRTYVNKSVYCANCAYVLLNTVFFKVNLYFFRICMVGFVSMAIKLADDYCRFNYLFNIQISFSVFVISYYNSYSLPTIGPHITPFLMAAIYFVAKILQMHLLRSLTTLCPSICVPSMILMFALTFLSYCHHDLDVWPTNWKYS